MRKKVIAAAFTLAIAAGLAGAWVLQTLPPPLLIVVNGLRFTVEFRAGQGPVVTIRPWSVARMPCPPQGTALVTLASGTNRMVEEFRSPFAFSVWRRAFGQPAAVYNIKAEALIEEREVRAPDGTTGTPEEAYRYLTDRFLTRDGVEGLFDDTRHDVAVAANDAVSRRNWRLFQGTDLDAVMFLEAEGREAEARGLAMQRLRYGSASPDLSDLILSWLSAKPVEGLKAIDELLSQGDGDFATLHTLRQELALGALTLNDLTGQYRRLYSENPGDLPRAYLYARLLPSDEAAEVLGGFADRMDECPQAAILLGDALLTAERFEGAADAFMRAAELLPDSLNLLARAEQALLLAGRSAALVEMPGARGRFPELFLSALLDLRRFDEADRYIADWKDDLPRETIIRYKLMVCLAREDYTAAEALAGIGGAPDDIHFLRVFACLSHGSLAEALENLSLIKGAAAYVLAAIAAGMYQDVSGMPDEARAAYSRVWERIAGAGGCAPHIEALANALVGRGEPGAAIGRAIGGRRYSDLPWMYAALGLRLKAHGDETAANGYLAKATQTNHFPGPFNRLVDKLTAQAKRGE